MSVPHLGSAHWVADETHRDLYENAEDSSENKAGHTIKREITEAKRDEPKGTMKMSHFRS